MDEPRKVNPESIEILGLHGEVVKEAKEEKRTRSYDTGFGQVKMIQASPWLLLLVPIVLPILVIALFFIAILAMFFGKSVFKIATKGIRRP